MRAVAVDGDHLATGCGDTLVRLFGLASGKLLRTLRAHAGRVYCVSLHGAVLLSGAGDKKVMVWSLAEDAAEGQRPVAVLEGHSATVRGVALAPSGRSIASVSSEYSKGEVMVHELAAGAAAKELLPLHLKV